MSDLPMNRVSLLTLGVSDLERARSFYTALGWQETAAVDGVAFYQMDGMVMALFGREPLAADQGRAGADLGTGAVTRRTTPTRTRSTPRGTARWTPARRR
jgi:hypothetical protein